MTLTLTPDIAEALIEQAQKQNLTPEQIALDSLRRRFVVSDEQPETMLDFLGDFVGCIDSSELVDGKSTLSEDNGKQFAELMQLKRQKGQL